MPYVKAELLKNEPIIVAGFDGAICADDFRAAFADMVRLSHQADGRVYAIADIRRTTSTLEQVIEQLREQAHGELAAANIVLVLVGAAAMSKYYVDAIRKNKHCGIQFPMFATMEAALDSVRLMVKRDSGTTRVARA